MKFFISSTQKDLLSYRQEAISYIEILNRRVGAMEYFGSDPKKPFDRCLEEVRNSDVFICLVAYNYGSIAPEYDLSYTEAEYDLAVSLKKPCFIFLASEENPTKFIINAGQYLLEKTHIERFREKLKKNHTISFFDSEQEFLLKLRQSITNAYPELKNNENNPPILDSFFNILENHHAPDLSYNLNETVNEKDCIEALKSSVTWLETTLPHITNSFDSIEDDLIKVFSTLDLDPKTLKNIPYYENPLINREWEVTHIGFPNILFKFKIITSLLQYFMYQKVIQLEPTNEEIKIKYANTRQNIEELLKRNYVD